MKPTLQMEIQASHLAKYKRVSTLGVVIVNLLFSGVSSVVVGLFVSRVSSVADTPIGSTASITHNVNIVDSNLFLISHVSSFFFK